MSLPLESVTRWFPRLLVFLIVVTTVMTVASFWFSHRVIGFFLLSLSFIFIGLLWGFYRYLTPQINRILALENWAYVSSLCGQVQPLPQDDLVSQTINKMFEELQVSQNFDCDFDQRIRSQVLLDPDTGIGNREFFNNRLEALLKEEDVQGAVYFIQFNDVELIQSLYGEQHTRQLFRQIINSITRHIGKISGSYIARRNVHELAIITPGVYFTEVERLANRLLKSISSVNLPVGVDSDSFVHIGVSYFSFAENSYQIKSEADMALRSAQLQGAISMVYV